MVPTLELIVKDGEKTSKQRYSLSHSLDGFVVAKEPTMLFKNSRIRKTSPLMWILRASTQSLQADPPVGLRSASPLTPQHVTYMLSEMLEDEGVEVSFGQQWIP